MKRGVTIALALGAVALLGGGLFFANEANVFPRSSREMRSFTNAEKIWGAGDYVCAKVAGRSGLRCASRGIGAEPVENAMTLEFLSSPTALIEDAPHVCALEGGELLCWDMATPMFGGLGLVYSPEQQRVGTIDHGTLAERAAVHVPMHGTVKAMVKYPPGFCVLDDQGITCVKYGDAKEREPSKVWATKGKTMLVASGDLLCTEEGDALQCFADPSRYTTGGAKKPDSPPLALKVRVAGAKDVTAIAASYGAFCTLSGGGVACGNRVNSGSSPALEELVLTRVEGLKTPTQLWSPGLDIFALDGDRIVELDDRAGFAVKVRGAVAPGEEVHADTGYDWFLYRSGQLVRSPNRPWPIKYDIGGKPSQVISLSLDTCALVGGRVTCFGY